MEIVDLKRDEQMALVGLMEFVAESNATVTDEEVQEISQVVDAIGPDKYRQLAEAVDERFANEESLKTHLLGVDRPEARDLIYGIALEMALSDAENLRHSEMLDWLREQWNISVEIGSV